MKACDQSTGGELKTNTNGRSLLKKTLEQPHVFDAQGRRIGALTGILLEDSGIKINKKSGITARPKRMPSPDMWEMKQMKGGQALHLLEEYNQHKDEDEADAEELKEEYAELEINEEEAPFLRGQTSKAGMCLEPIKISRDADGSM